MCEPSLPEEPLSQPSPPPPPRSKRQRTSSPSRNTGSFSQNGPPIQQTGGKTVLNIPYSGGLSDDASHVDHRPHQPPTPPVDETLAHQPTFENSSPFQANESQGSWSIEQSHPSFVASRKLDMGVCRQFPLQDYNEACLFRYYIDEVAPWVSELLSSTDLE